LGDVEETFADRFGSFLRDYINSFDARHLINANDHITANCLHHIHNFRSHYRIGIKESPIRGLEDIVDSVGQQIYTLKNDLENQSQQFQEAKDALQSTGDAAAADFTNQQDQIRTAFEQMRNEFKESQSTRSEDFANDQRERQTEFTDDQNARKKEFTDEQATRVVSHATWFEETQKRIEDEFSATADNFQTSAAALVAELEKTTSGIKTKAEEFLTEIRKIYKLVGNDSLSGSHLQNAKSEQKAANIWNFFTIVFIILTIGWSIYSYHHSAEQQQDATIISLQLIKTGSVTVIVLFGVIYCARQARTHSQNSKRVRWLGLQMEAINPYINEFDADQKADFKDRIGDKLFGSHPEDAAQLSKAEKLPFGMGRWFWDFFNRHNSPD
jgi:hypothetical protein